MKTRTHILAWILSTITVSLWIGVVFFVLHIEDMSVLRDANIAAQKNNLMTQATDSMIYSTAAETQARRQELEGFIGIDPVAITRLLTTTAQSIGTTITITSAGLAGRVTIGSLAANSAPEVFGFETDSQGSFSSLIHTAELFETLPAISSIQQLDLMHSGPSMDVSNTVNKNTNATWHMNAQIQVLTNSAISS